MAIDDIESWLPLSRNTYGSSVRGQRCNRRDREERETPCLVTAGEARGHEQQHDPDQPHQRREPDEDEREDGDARRDQASTATRSSVADDRDAPTATRPPRRPRAPDRPPLSREPRGNRAGPAECAPRPRWPPATGPRPGAPRRQQGARSAGRRASVPLRREAAEVVGDERVSRCGHHGVSFPGVLSRMSLTAWEKSCHDRRKSSTAARPAAVVR